MRRVIGAVLFVACGFAALVHGLTFLAIDATMAWPRLWILHPAAIIALASTLFSGVPLDVTRRTTIWDWLEGDDRDPNVSVGTTDSDRANDEADFGRRLRPSRRKVIVAILAVYAAINFAASLSLLQGGVPVQRGDEYVLTSHGHVVKTLSPTEYASYRAYQTRLATGHWMLLFFLSGAIWTVRRSGQKRQAGRLNEDVGTEA